MKLNFALLLSMVIVFVAGCKVDELEPLEKNTDVPGAISNVKWVAGPGNATLTYAVPNNNNLLYVKAVYTLASGRIMEVKASYYGNTLKVEGFGDTEEHEVKLYAVTRSEIESAPVSVKVKPLENPIWGVFRSIKAQADFGGLRFTAKNIAKADLAIEILTEDSKGKLVPTSKNIYTSIVDIDQAIRGYDPIERKFAITIRDRWLNYSDTLYTSLTPLYEAVIPKSGYKSVTLPSDVALNTSTSIAGMWDGDTNGWPRVLMTSSGVLTPQWVTFDIGKLSSLSRIVMWDYPEYLNGRTYYYGGNLLDFEVWGTDNPPSDGSFTNWTKLGTFKSIKPSGSAYGVNTAEDNTIGAAGLNYTFDPGIPKVRYIRIKSLKNWQGTTFMAIGEIQLYGDPR
ncbi:DUF4959 domain-containing protein [Pedobacter sp. MR2016-19]|uniref:DUF5000 domain-containing lipoprotein n=1 Tax=Pedobacter sp. MR2016-19 TaxID=2780089 RepID=UPI0018761F39|nr:DUF5000 domain-containing lipoprotein [Pedobacter sp. MR2016-19]MBE5322089.1 DUF4959 domain-containing protein [Pedobacter sp. MR2016-19]